MSHTVAPQGTPSKDPGREPLSFRWEQGRYGVLHLYAGTFKAPLASVSRSMTRNDPARWQVRSGLPGYSLTRKTAEEDAAKALAERIVATFVAKISAPSVVERGE